jgi:hypothetical protein
MSAERAIADELDRLIGPRQPQAPEPVVHERSLAQAFDVLRRGSPNSPPRSGARLRPPPSAATPSPSAWTASRSAPSPRRPSRSPAPYAPESKVSKTGKPFVVAKLREGAGDAVVWWSVVAFAGEAREELLRLSDGEAVAVSRPFSLTTYGRNGEVRLNHSIIAERLISARWVKKREHAPAYESA